MAAINRASNGDALSPSRCCITTFSSPPPINAVNMRAKGRLANTNEKPIERFAMLALWVKSQAPSHISEQENKGPVAVAQKAHAGLAQSTQVLHEEISLGP